MKNKLRILGLAIIIAASSLGLKAQKFVQTDFLRAGTADASKLFEAYLKPWGNMFGASLNGGWYNSAKPHKLVGFSVNISTITGIAPSADKTFDISSIGLENLSLANPADNMAPTVAGKFREKGPQLVYTENIAGNDYEIARFNTPSGTGMRIFPMPMLQLNVGFLKGTELMFRYVPDINLFDAGKLGLYGFGLKHSIFQYLPMDKLIPMDVSILGGYTRFNTTSNVNYQPLNSGAMNIVYNTTKMFNNQQMAMNVEGITGMLIASSTLPLFNVYGGVGYSHTRTKLSLEGNYPFPTVNTATGNLEVGDAQVINNPINMDIRNNSGLRYNIGARLKFIFFTIYADYTYDYYSVFTLGVGAGLYR